MMIPEEAALILEKSAALSRMREEERAAENASRVPQIAKSEAIQAKNFLRDLI